MANAAIFSETMDDYDADILIWSERQANLLQRLAAGEQINAQVDWLNVIEEIESVGKEQLHAVESLLVQAMIHMLKAEGWPTARDAPNWRAEAIRFRGEAAVRFAPSMRQKIDLVRLHRLALRALPETIDGAKALPFKGTLPTLDELLSDQ